MTQHGTLYRRREVIAGGVAGVGALALGASFWSDLFGNGEAPAPTAGRNARASANYGPLRRPDAHGIRLPEGFEARRIARGGERVAGYRWHKASDGMATFEQPDGGWILVSNSEELKGGAGAVRFNARGRIVEAQRILHGTTNNCSGGPTPWGTWLSCEETESGRVWECDPTGERKAVVHPAMGVFKHEAAAVDPHRRVVYLTEDLRDGGLYRFVPDRWPDLAAGRLEIARVGRRGAVTWIPVPDPAARRVPTRRQVPGSTRFRRGEGIWYDEGTVYVATTIDAKVHALDTDEQRIETIYDGFASRTAPLLRTDNITVSRAGEVFVCEDLSTNEIDIGVIDPETRAARRFLSVTGPDHAGSELTGVTFDPWGRRMYFSSQRAFGGRGAVYEVAGPFNGTGRPQALAQARQHQDRQLP